MHLVSSDFICSSHLEDSVGEPVSRGKYTVFVGLGLECSCCVFILLYKECELSSIGLVTPIESLHQTEMRSFNLIFLVDMSYP